MFVYDDSGKPIDIHLIELDVSYSFNCLESEFYPKIVLNQDTIGIAMNTCSNTLMVFVADLGSKPVPYKRMIYEFLHLD